MRLHQRTIRSAFSLLEMVLALALAMVLLLALYLTLNTYLTSTYIGRDTLAEGEISRSIMARFSHDISNQLGAFDTRCLPSYEPPPADDPTAAPVPATVPADAVKFNIGIFGEASTLRLSVYRAEKPSAGAIANQAQGEVMSDLRRIDYWLVQNGAETLGLARREVKLATSLDIDSEPTELADQEKYLIAREVKGLTLEYFDGAAWQASWDGSQPFSAEITTPLGPPSAVKITLTLRRATNKLLTRGAEQSGPDLTYTHVVAIAGGNKFSEKTTTP